jgi:hypothetical protein
LEICSALARAACLAAIISANLDSCRKRDLSKGESLCALAWLRGHPSGLQMKAKTVFDADEPQDLAMAFSFKRSPE